MEKQTIPHLAKILRDKATVITRAVFWRIPHNSDKEDVRLKIGRYKKPKSRDKLNELEYLSPKSELTLDDEEFRNLIEFVQENYEPFKAGAKAFIPLDHPFDAHTAEAVKGLFNHPEKVDLIDFISRHDIIPEHLMLALHLKKRMQAIAEFETMLSRNLVEQPWQKWFQKNGWVLGTDFVRVLDERRIDTEHISDFLMEAYDGFLDIVEIKRPEGTLSFWAAAQDHGNYIPSSDLIKAATQASRYLFEVEREANSLKFLERVDHVKTIKPRSILIFGRSHDWNNEQRESYRILNSSFHNLTILTYDHVLERAQSLLKHDENSVSPDAGDTERYVEVPF
ncbi:DUF4263 domain-containing protein [archaeon]|nr:MAG: DUF4263 domain-containing protein [archaeon]